MILKARLDHSAADLYADLALPGQIGAADSLNLAFDKAHAMRDGRIPVLEQGRHVAHMG